MNHAYPLALILTHRRGAAVAILKAEDDKHPVFVRTLGQTAENLSALYQGALRLCGLKIQDIKSLAVGVGPGSFTGLRLGCAFANGLKRGYNCVLIPVPTRLSSYFFQENIFSTKQEREEFQNQLGLTQPSDESSGKVTFFDLQEALRQLPTCTPVESLEPQYGRAPTPVLKLMHQKDQ